MLTPVFLNSTKSKSGDTYNDYRGNSVWEILQAVGVLETVDGVDLLSADGYERTFTLDELKKAWPQGSPVMGLSNQELGACGWVRYGSRGLDPSKPLPDARIILAFEENGHPLEKARLEPGTGRIVGKGPLRTIVPQFRFSPPDLPQFADASCMGRVAAEHRFHEEYDHNAGASVLAIVAVRIKPLPKGRLTGRSAPRLLAKLRLKPSSHERGGLECRNDVGTSLATGVLRGGVLSPGSLPGGSDDTQHQRHYPSPRVS